MDTRPRAPSILGYLAFAALAFPVVIAIVFLSAGGASAPPGEIYGAVWVGGGFALWAAPALAILYASHLHVRMRWKGGRAWLLLPAVGLGSAIAFSIMACLWMSVVGGLLPGPHPFDGSGNFGILILPFFSAISLAGSLAVSLLLAAPATHLLRAFGPPPFPPLPAAPTPSVPPPRASPQPTGPVRLRSEVPFPSGGGAVSLRVVGETVEIRTSATGVFSVFVTPSPGELVASAHRGKLLGYCSIPLAGLSGRLADPATVPEPQSMSGFRAVRIRVGPLVWSPGAWGLDVVPRAFRHAFVSDPIRTVEIRVPRLVAWRPSLWPEKRTYEDVPLLVSVEDPVALLALLGTAPRS